MVNVDMHMYVYVYVYTYLCICDECGQCTLVDLGSKYDKERIGAC